MDTLMGFKYTEQEIVNARNDEYNQSLQEKMEDLDKKMKELEKNVQKILEIVNRTRPKYYKLQSPITSSATPGSAGP